MLANIRFFLFECIGCEPACHTKVTHLCKNSREKGRTNLMNNTKKWISAGLVILLYSTGVGIYELRKAPATPAHQEQQVQEEQSESALPVFSSQVMHVGSFGDDVYELQGRLSYLGYYYGKHDSYYGEKTRDSIKWFQSEFGIKPDGVAGPKTKLKLYNASKKWQPGGDQGANTAQSPKKTTSESTANKGTAQETTKENKKDESTAVTSSNALGLSDNDLKIMANAVYGESRGEPFEGQVAVAAVILNRVKSPSFPNTTNGVIFQPGAFTAVADGQIWLEPNDSARKAVQQAIDGWDPSGGCLYYFNPETATSKWIWTRSQVKTIGKHIFCM